MNTISVKNLKDRLFCELKAAFIIPTCSNFRSQAFRPRGEVTLNAAARHFRTLRREIKIPHGALASEISHLKTGQTDLARC